MLMDLACPAEFVSVEVLRDSGGRAQAYLTFRNLSEDTLTELHATITMLDEAGMSLGVCPLRYRRLQAKPAAMFTLCMVMDELPFFGDARATIQRVGFAQGEPWVWDEDALKDCTPKPLAPGPQRSALMAVAGPDAICWPERRQDAWVCVCGRFNQRGWRICRRCRRTREEVFARYELGAVMAQYQRQRSAQEAGERSERQQAERTRAVKHGRRRADFLRRLKLLHFRRRGFWMAVIAALLLAWGAWSMLF
ncbi:MAG: hypothetical protein FWE77_04295 [Clostridia bacterium]|nr:hypothetical protein [Clostridia bacterium]